MQINNLKEQHKTIHELILEMDKQVDSRDIETNSQEVAINISKLAGILKIHLSSEDKFLYPRLKEAKDLKVQELATKYDAEMGDLSQAYIDFKGKYNTRIKINADINGFKKEYNDVIKLLKERLMKEDNDLYPMAEKL